MTSSACDVTAAMEEKLKNRGGQRGSNSAPQDEQYGALTNELSSAAMLRRFEELILKVLVKDSDVSPGKKRWILHIFVQ